MDQNTKLTPEILLSLGFYGEGKSITKNPLYRIKCNHHYYLQVELNDYPDTNPNSGIVSIFHPELKDQHCHVWEKKDQKSKKLKKRIKRIDYVESEDDEFIHGIQYITFHETHWPIAWHVTTVGRLNDIYTSLTNLPALKSRKLPK